MSTFPFNSYFIMVKRWKFFRKYFDFISSFLHNGSIKIKRFWYIEKICWSNTITKIIYVTLDWLIFKHLSWNTLTYLETSYYTINKTFRIISFLIFMRNKFYFLTKIWRYTIRLTWISYYHITFVPLRNFRWTMCRLFCCFPINFPNNSSCLNVCFSSIVDLIEVTDN